MDAVASALGANSSTTSIPLHPYYPLEVEIIGYLANEWSVPLLLGVFAALLVVLLGGTRVIAKMVQPHIQDSELLCVMWFVMSKLVHWLALMDVFTC